MGKGGRVTREVMAKICRAPDCKVDNIMEIIGEDA
jgi:DNA-binding Xre family transcriptional regulator